MYVGDLDEGFYPISVVDAVGCAKDEIVEIRNYGFAARVQPSNIICAGGFGDFDVYPIGGTPPYIYSFNGSSPEMV